jgi:hypothetical protein
VAGDLRLRHRAEPLLWRGKATAWRLQVMNIKVGECLPVISSAVIRGTSKSIYLQPLGKHPQIWSKLPIKCKFLDPFLAVREKRSGTCIFPNDSISMHRWLYLNGIIQGQFQSMSKPRKFSHRGISSKIPQSTRLANYTASEIFKLICSS